MFLVPQALTLSSSKKKIMKTGSEYLLKYIKVAPDKKNHLIEPMCCLIRLGILNFKEPGTKIRIYDNSINYYEPNLIQGILRTWHGDNRDDLHNLYNPIIIALKWFYPSNEFYKAFFILARDGIIKLKLVYEYNSIIHHTLNHYIRTIVDVLNKVDEPDIFTKEDVAFLNKIDISISNSELSNREISDRENPTLQESAGNSVYHSTLEDSINSNIDIDNINCDIKNNTKNNKNNTKNKNNIKNESKTKSKNNKLSVKERTEKIEKLKKLEKLEKNMEDVISKKYNVRFHDELEPEPEITMDQESACENLNKSTIKNEHTNFIEIFRNLWTDNELTIVSSTFNHLTNIKDNASIRDESQRRELIDTYLKSVEIIVTQKEKEVKNIIMSTISSY